MTAVVVTSTLAMALVLVVAGLALGFVSWLHRGESVPGAPWLDDLFARATRAVPVLRDGDLDGDPDGDLNRGLDRADGRAATREERASQR